MPSSTTTRAATPRLLLDAREAAAALSISTRSLWSITHPRGPVPVVRIGSRVLYSVADLQAAIERMKGGNGNG